MKNRLRELRKARNLTLADVAARCRPETTAVTIGRLETGTRQLTLAWLDRLAAALAVDPGEILAQPGDTRVPVAATLDADGPHALSATLDFQPPVPGAGHIGLLVRASQGDYRAGDQLWLEQLPPERFSEAINTDILVPRPVGRFAFGRLLATSDGRLHLLPARPGSRQAVLAEAPWIARTRLLIRAL